MNKVIIILLTTLSAFIQEASNLNLKNGIAIRGYDPVSYYLDGRPRVGKTEVSTKYMGATYHFANQKNKELFAADPQKYQPQYGGWCAYAMGNSGEKVRIDPETYKILDGKLYLFYNFFFNNTLDDWNKNEVELKQQADTNWSKILGK